MHSAGAILVVLTGSKYQLSVLAERIVRHLLIIVPMALIAAAVAIVVAG